MSDEKETVDAEVTETSTYEKKPTPADVIRWVVGCGKPDAERRAEALGKDADGLFDEYLAAVQQQPSKLYDLLRLAEERLQDPSTQQDE